jgi:hypothetical protein
LLGDWLKLEIFDSHTSPPTNLTWLGKLVDKLHRGWILARMRDWQARENSAILKNSRRIFPAPAKMSIMIVVRRAVEA